MKVFNFISYFFLFLSISAEKKNLRLFLSINCEYCCEALAFVERLSSRFDVQIFFLLDPRDIRSNFILASIHDLKKLNFVMKHIHKRRFLLIMQDHFDNTEYKQIIKTNYTKIIKNHIQIFKVYKINCVPSWLIEDHSLIHGVPEQTEDLEF